MKVLFVIYDNEAEQNPIPMGSAYIAATCKQAGCDVTYYSQDVYHYPEEHLTKYLNENHFDILGLGFTAGYFQYQKIQKICKAINKSRDRPFVVLGGYGPSPAPEFWIEKTGADAVVCGEGEYGIIELLDSMKPGIYHSEAVKKLDELPLPYYDALPMDYYLNHHNFTTLPTDRFLPMVTSRGCPYHCNFCQKQPGSYPRIRSADAVSEELGKYVKDYGVSYIQFWDELFCLNEKRTYALTEAIRPHNIRYWCTARVDTINEDMIEMLKSSGCEYIDYGIEQFDNKALEAMNKGQTEEQILKAIEITHNANIKIGFNIIWGNIGDTKESLDKSMELLREYNDFGQLRTIRPVTPYPGSPLFDYAVKNGYLKDVRDFYDKHRNVELFTCNFTDIPDYEFHYKLWECNYELITSYYAHLADNMTEDFFDVYFGRSYDFRGARHK